MIQEKAAGYMVFWMEDTGSHMGVWEPKCQFFSPLQMSDALNRMNDLRKREDVEFVGFVSQDANSVGLPGVTSIESGKTPDGYDYDWKKRR
jgi:hypothetical protein